MNLIFNYKVWKDRRRLSANRQFRRALWRSLEARWDSLQLPAYAWYQTHLFRSLAAGVSSLLITVSFATGAFAYVSPTVTDGTALYPVKRTLEKVVEKTKRTPESRSMFYIKQVKRREQELHVLQEQQKPIQTVEASIHQLEGKLEDEQVSLVARSGPAADQAFETVSKHLDEYAASDTEFTDQELEAAVESADNDLETTTDDNQNQVSATATIKETSESDRPQVQGSSEADHSRNNSDSNDQSDE